MKRLTFRPFQGSRTFHNLLTEGAGVFHVTDDVELLAHAAIGDVDPPTHAASKVRGRVVDGACRAYEFRVIRRDTSTERATFEAEVVHREDIRPYFGLNRGKHAVLEAAILATRVHLLPVEEVSARFESLAVLVDKTGGPQEKRALRFLREFVDRVRAAGAAGKPEVGVRVRTGGRLHFGLLALRSENGRSFGGCGLMVEDGGVTLDVEPAAAFAVDGPNAETVREFARRWAGDTPPRCRIRVVQAPPRHSGLGSGTQLALAVARGLAELAGESPPAPELALRVGRGRRSAVGIHGFAHGGFIVEGGKTDSTMAPLVCRCDFPDAWRILVASPRETGLSGAVEEEAFASLGTNSKHAAVLSRILVQQMIPSLRAADLPKFGVALYEYNRLSGEYFAAAQGGAYASPEVAELVEFLRGSNVPAVAQSSWGPAVCAVVDGGEQAEKLREQTLEFLGGRSEHVFVTRARNQGASVEPLVKPPSLHTLA